MGEIFIWGTQQEISSASVILDSQVKGIRTEIKNQILTFHPAGPGVKCTVGLTSSNTEISDSLEEDNVPTQKSNHGNHPSLSILRHVGDIRSMAALGRQAVIYNAEKLTADLLSQYCIY